MIQLGRRPYLKATVEVFELGLKKRMIRLSLGFGVRNHRSTRRTKVQLGSEEMTILHSFSDSKAGCLNRLADRDAILAIAAAQREIISSEETPGEGGMLLYL
jgi:hypothetical protein